MKRRSFWRFPPGLANQDSGLRSVGFAEGLARQRLKSCGGNLRMISVSDARFGGFLQVKRVKTRQDIAPTDGFIHQIGNVGLCKYSLKLTHTLLAKPTLLTSMK